VADKETSELKDQTSKLKGANAELMQELVSNDKRRADSAEAFILVLPPPRRSHHKMFSLLGIR
jgi:hypothetical protein